MKYGGLRLPFFGGIMVIYLKHPQHGTKVAISDVEANQDMQNGWEVYNAGTLLTPKEAAPVVDAPISEPPKQEDVEIEVLRELWAEKFGKAPHHKKSAASLRKELGNGECR